MKHRLIIHELLLINPVVTAAYADLGIVSVSAVVGGCGMSYPPLVAGKT